MIIISQNSALLITFTAWVAPMLQDFVCAFHCEKQNNPTRCTRQINHIWLHIDDINASSLLDYVKYSRYTFIWEIRHIITRTDCHRRVNAQCLSLSNWKLQNDHRNTLERNLLEQTNSLLTRQTRVLREHLQWRTTEDEGEKMSSNTAYQIFNR